MPAMRSSPLLLLPVLAGLLSLAACDQPKFRESKDAPPPAAPAAAAAPPARVIPSDPAGAPASPAWAKDVVGKGLREVYSKTGTCMGNTDIVQKTYDGEPKGAQIHGWGWDKTKNARVERVVLVDPGFKIVAAGDGGVDRPDVPRGVPEVTDGKTGWNVDVAMTSGVLSAYGVTDDGAGVCVLGRIEF